VNAACAASLRSKRISFPTIYLFLHFSNSDFALRKLSERAFNSNRFHSRFQLTSCHQLPNSTRHDERTDGEKGRAGYRDRDQSSRPFLDAVFVSAPLDEAVVQKSMQMTSSARALTVVWPGGKRMVYRGDPLASHGSIAAASDALNERGVPTTS